MEIMELWNAKQPDSNKNKKEGQKEKNKNIENQEGTLELSQTSALVNNYLRTIDGVRIKIVEGDLDSYSSGKKRGDLEEGKEKEEGETKTKQKKNFRIENKPKEEPKDEGFYKEELHIDEDENTKKRKVENYEDIKLITISNNIKEDEFVDLILELENELNEENKQKYEKRLKSEKNWSKHCLLYTSPSPRD